MDEDTGAGVAVSARDNDPYEIPVGESATVGRRADVVMGTDDLLHGVAFRIEVEREMWTVRVPGRNRLEVLAYVGSRRVWAGRGGSSWSTDSDTATLQVKTAEALHEVVVTRRATGDTWVGEASDTRDVERLLDLTNANHRAIVVACSDRLHDATAGALEAAAVARHLNITPPAAARRLSRALVDVKELLEDYDGGGQPRPCLSRDDAVDWLVSSSIVSSEHFVEALGLEAESRRTRRDLRSVG